MKTKFTRELVVAHEIIGWLLIMIGLSFYIPHTFFYLTDLVTFFESKRPGSIFPSQAKPIFPDIPSLWVVAPCIVGGVLVILFARVVRKTFKIEQKAGKLTV